MAIRKNIGNDHGGTCLLLCCLVLVFSMIFAYVFSFVCLAVNMNSAKKEVIRCLDSYAAETSINNFDYLKNRIDSVTLFSADDFLARLAENSGFVPSGNGYAFIDSSGNTVFHLTDFSISENYRNRMIYSVTYTVCGRFRISGDLGIPYALTTTVLSDYISK